ncbi:hypothetical protein EVAR_790_1 [Eumeta japonica]|uniref:Uncharacterized protein n=1 Tax=Eumeta variegata TaxID=151549 RepID=A0A4C1SF05_EUMVA|nr:hypothetical protein EVAR_790_1 [Eumeta japonica]
MPEWKGRVPLTRSHCERITIEPIVTKSQTVPEHRPHKVSSRLSRFSLLAAKSKTETTCALPQMTHAASDRRAARGQSIY